VTQIAYFSTETMNACHEAMLQIIYNATSYTCQAAKGCTSQKGTSNTCEHWNSPCS
jgi:hypothetical protein